ncbi:MAG: fibronectin type III domain-containing protein [Kiritimatiellae bacterium]|nr:fibronectin type III domain-containing protein [Kiritimatiellia bacterium]
MKTKLKSAGSAMGILLALTVLEAPLHTASAEHPLLLVTADMYPELRARASQSPWSTMKAKAVSDVNGLSYNSGSSRSSRAYRIRDIAQAGALACILDPANKTTYKNKVRDILLKWQDVGLPPSTDHGDIVSPGASLMVSILALDILHDELTASELAAVEAAMSPLAEWYWTHGTAWQLNLFGVRGTWALYKQDRSRIDKAKADYKNHLFSQVTPDGGYDGGGHYYWARLGGRSDRGPSKTHFMDVLRFTGEMDLLSDGRVTQFYENMPGCALTPFRRTLTFGDGAYNEQIQSGNDTLLFTGHRVSGVAAREMAWVLGNDSVPNQNVLLAYLLMKYPLPAPEKPRSRIVRDTGAFFWENNTSDRSLMGALRSCVTDDWHSHKDVNALHLSAYGENMLQNVGYKGASSDYNSTFTWTYINHQAFGNNVALINGADHATKKGAGIREGFTAPVFDYACADSGSAIAGGTHLRNLVMVHPQDGCDGYYLVFDELDAANPAHDVQVLWHPASASYTTVTAKQEYRWTIRKFSGHDVYLSVFLARAPDAVQIKDSPFCGWSGASYLGKYLHTTYGTDAAGKANVLTALFPHDDTHAKAGMSRLGGTGYSGVKLAHAGGVTDWAVESGGAAGVTVGGASFTGKACVFRTTGPDCLFYFVRQGTAFESGTSPALGFTAPVPVSLYLRGTTGRIMTPAARIRFRYPGVIGVSVNGTPLSAAARGTGWVEADVPAGTHPIELAVDGAAAVKESQWKYKESGAALPDAWNTLTYDDGAWSCGEGPLGYGETYVNTRVRYGADPTAKYPTTCFRKRFQLGAGPAQVAALTLRMAYDDGFVAYLNGTEVARRGLGTGSVGYGDFASSHEGNTYETIDLTAHKSLLRTGANVLAVELHQADAGSSDLVWDAELTYTLTDTGVPAAPSDLRAEPVSASAIRVSWIDNSTNEENFKVRRSADGVNFDHAIIVPAGITSCMDTGLEPGATTYYQVKAEHSTEGDSDYVGPVAATTLVANRPFTAYNDLAWAAGQRAQNITTYTRAQGGWLRDNASDLALAATLTVDGGGDGPILTQGADAAPGTDADTVFNGIVDCAGLISYGEPLGLTFAGLDPALRYECVLFGNRDNAAYTDRLTTVTIAGAERFANRSSAGASYSGESDPATVVCNGWNTKGGRVARFADIAPGADGTFSLTVSDPAGRFYANAVMLQATDTGEEPFAAIAKGGTWRYRKGTAEASAPAAAWRDVRFDDSRWAAGPAPIGYGGGEATPLDDMYGSYSCVFLRKHFTIGQPAAITQMRLAADYDDGFIAWLNGAELARVNVPGQMGEFVAHDAFAAANMSAAWAQSFTGADIPVLLQTNVLAVQVFNRSLTSGDLAFDAELSVVSSRLSVADDADQDSMPDAWETAHLSGLPDPADRACSADPDGDGLSNLEEFIAGTDPLVAPPDETTQGEGGFRVEVQLNGGKVTVSFSTVAAAGAGYEGLTRHYRLEQADGPDNRDWQPVPGYEDVIGAGQTVVLLPVSGPNITLYRARVWLQAP